MPRRATKSMIPPASRLWTVGQESHLGIGEFFPKEIYLPFCGFMKGSVKKRRWHIHPWNRHEYGLFTYSCRVLATPKLPCIFWLFDFHIWSLYTVFFEGKMNITQISVGCFSSFQRSLEPSDFSCEVLDVSENSGTPKSSHFNRVFHYKPSILGFPYFWKHPCLKLRSLKNMENWTSQQHVQFLAGKTVTLSETNSKITLKFGSKGAV